MEKIISPLIEKAWASGTQQKCSLLPWTDDVVADILVNKDLNFFALDNLKKKFYEIILLILLVKSFYLNLSRITSTDYTRETVVMSLQKIWTFVFKIHLHLNKARFSS